MNTFLKTALAYSEMLMLPGYAILHDWRMVQRLGRIELH